MKTVLLLRHGKSDWEAERDDDHDRPLSPRGVRAARLMGRYLADVGAVPDRVLTSSALRAMETVRLAAEAGEWDRPIDVTPELYEASSREAVHLLRRADDSLERLLLVGHEPTWSTLVAQLTGGSHVRFPTAAVARIDFAVDRWDDVRPGRGVLIWLVPPRLLGKLGYGKAHSKSS